jgi:hypothetical protein
MVSLYIFSRFQEENYNIFISKGKIEKVECFIIYLGKRNRNEGIMRNKNEDGRTVPSIQGDSLQAPQQPRNPRMVMRAPTPSTTYTPAPHKERIIDLLSSISDFLLPNLKDRPRQCSRSATFWLPGTDLDPYL